MPDKDDVEKNLINRLKDSRTTIDGSKEKNPRLMIDTFIM